ncbi:MAG: STAS domain-containing protein [Chitinispirillaceae bacterium]|nr:STAS domain-containing protein [Chitinispirillaceae bacterium]
MRSETLDLSIESRSGDLWFTLSGPFTQEQIPTFREKFLLLIEDGNRSFILDMESISAIDPGAIHLLLQLLSSLKEKKGSLKLIFTNELLTRTFHPYRNIFSIYPDSSLLIRRGFFAFIYKQQRILSRKTGIRLSRPVALFLLIILCGWFISLGFIIHLQNRYIKNQNTELQELSQWEASSRLEIERLRNRLEPLEQLGIVRDTLESP